MLSFGIQTTHPLENFLWENAILELRYNRYIDWLWYSMPGVVEDLQPLLWKTNQTEEGIETTTADVKKAVI